MSADTDRLTEWADDANHVVQSVRFYQPTYANPAEIRRDVRELLARAEAAEAQRDTLQGDVDKLVGKIGGLMAQRDTLAKVAAAVVADAVAVGPSSTSEVDSALIARLGAALAAVAPPEAKP